MSAKVPARKTKRLTKFVTSGRPDTYADSVELMISLLQQWVYLAGSDDPRSRIAGKSYLREAAEYIVQAKFEEQSRKGRPTVGDLHVAWFDMFLAERIKPKNAKLTTYGICKKVYDSNRADFKNHSLATVYGAVLKEAKIVFGKDFPQKK